MKSQKKLTNEEIASFCTQTALLFQSGIPPVECLSILLSDIKSPEGKALLEEIIAVCRQGEPFHKALESSGVFPEYVLRTIAMGEESGNLDTCMLSLADYYEKEISIAESIKSAVSYPLVMIAMMLVVIFVLISRVLPIFNQVFIELGSEMNGFAASLLKLGTHLNRYSAIFLILLLLLCALYFFCTRTAVGKRFSSKLWMRLPFIQNFHNDVACERFASGMALCLSSGIDTYTSLDIVNQLVGNKQMQEKIAACKSAIQSGANLADALTRSEIFSNLYSQMVAVGFRSGNVDKVLAKIAEHYEHSSDKKMQTLISVLEPTLVIILSIIVGLILLSVILPLMGIMTSIG